MIAFVAGYALFLRIGARPSFALFLLPTMLLIGVGFALTFPSLNIQATAGVADHEQGLASGLVNTSFQVGGAIVLAGVSAVVPSRGGGTSFLDAMRPALGVVIGVAVIGLVISVSGLIRGREAVAP